MSRYVLMNVGATWFTLNVDDSTKYESGSSLMFDVEDIVISFQISDLIREFTARGITVLPNLIDLKSFDKQMSQEGNDLYNFDNWKAINMLKFHKIIDDNFELKESTFKLFLEHLSALFINLLESDEEEKKRFESIELKINKLIYERQLLGIHIDKDIAVKKCHEIEKEIYRIKNILQLEYNIYSPDIENQMREWILSKNYKIIHSLLYSFKIRKDNDIVCNYYYELIRNKQDLDSLLFILSEWGGRERTYPSYSGFGTITSRIILSQPSLQNIRKVNRSVIIADIGKKLLYIDYSQFEAGILASLSNDEDLIKLYDTDIYKDLAIKVLKNEKKRDAAKIIFYRYMYGDSTLKGEKEAYFLNFKNLNKYKQKIEANLNSDKKIGTSQGNYRQRNNDESNWGLSHVVQATASLILKNALLRVNSEIPSAEFLIPMHDAALYQLNEFQFDDYKEKIEKIYKEEFNRICPQILPQVNFEDFYTEKSKVKAKMI